MYIVVYSMIFSSENTMISKRKYQVVIFCNLFTFILYFTLRITSTPSYIIVYCDWKRVSTMIMTATNMFSERRYDREFAVNLVIS